MTSRKRELMLCTNNMNGVTLDMARMLLSVGIYRYASFKLYYVPTNKLNKKPCPIISEWLTTIYRYYYIYLLFYFEFIVNI